LKFKEGLVNFDQYDNTAYFLGDSNQPDFSGNGFDGADMLKTPSSHQKDI